MANQHEICLPLFSSPTSSFHHNRISFAILLFFFYFVALYVAWSPKHTGKFVTTMEITPRLKIIYTVVVYYLFLQLVSCPIVAIAKHFNLFFFKIILNMLWRCLKHLQESFCLLYFVVRLSGSELLVLHFWTSKIISRFRFKIFPYQCHWCAWASV